MKVLIADYLPQLKLIEGDADCFSINLLQVYCRVSFFIKLNAILASISDSDKD